MAFAQEADIFKINAAFDRVIGLETGGRIWREGLFIDLGQSKLVPVSLNA